VSQEYLLHLVGGILKPYSVMGDKKAGELSGGGGCSEDLRQAHRNAFGKNWGERGTDHLSHSDIGRPEGGEGGGTTPDRNGSDVHREW